MWRSPGLSEAYISCRSFSLWALLLQVGVSALGKFETKLTELSKYDHANFHSNFEIFVYLASRPRS